MQRLDVSRFPYRFGLYGGIQGGFAPAQGKQRAGLLGILGSVEAARETSPVDRWRCGQQSTLIFRQRPRDSAPSRRICGLAHRHFPSHISRVAALATGNVYVDVYSVRAHSGSGKRVKKFCKG